ncbi:PAN domain-containing protein [Agrobacterium salinitolerans]|nr:PAN domain-containing protein [Agrobacterium salinitolerans]
MRVLILAAVCASVAFPCRADPASEFLEYPDAALSGKETAKLDNTGLERCRQLCSERSGCAGFEHEETANICRMFSEIVTARDSRGVFAASRNEVAGFRPPSNLRPVSVPKPSISRWNHNGSVMSLHQKPNPDGTIDVEIVYDLPKDQLLKVGIRSGSTLFRGTLSAGILTGRSRLTSSRCGIIEYDVQGPFDPQSSVPLYLRGAAPKRGEDCSVESWNSTGDNANLRFDPQ